MMLPRVSDGRQRVTGTGILFLTFAAVLNVFVSFADAAPSPWSLASPNDDNDDNNGNPMAMPQGSVPFSSAVAIEERLSRQHAQLANSPASPLQPGGSVSDSSQLADLMPPLQKSAVEVNHADVLASMKEPLIGRHDPTTTAKDSTVDFEVRAPQLRVMIVGDSMTQGQQGDWTWRYRIWQWFTSQAIDVDFVGPYNGTVPPKPPAAPSPPALYGKPQPTHPVKTTGGYAAGVSPNFDSDHFSVWGRAAAVDKSLIQEAVTHYQADLILLMLGFNDLGWYYSDAPGLLDNMHTLITNARAANPNLKFAVANVPQRKSLGRADLPKSTAQYNGLLRDAIPKWTSSQSPIKLVELEENYECQPSSCPVGYDGLHPNALGEFQIARAFSLTLVRDFQIGLIPLEIPKVTPPRPLPVPSNFNVSSTSSGVTATWDAVYGAYSYDVETRTDTTSNFSTTTASTNRWDPQWPQNGSVYEVKVRAAAGTNRTSDWTTVKSAKSRPQLAPGPRNIVVKPTDTGMNITWDPPTGPYTDSIIEYNVLYRDDGSSSFLSGAAFTSSPAYIDKLTPGHHYYVAVETWNAAGEGLPETVKNGVTIGGGNGSVAKESSTSPFLN